MPVFAPGSSFLSGFTMIEMLVVCGMILLLAAGLVAIGAEIRDRILVRQTRTTVAHMALAMENYHMEFGRYPRALTVLGERHLDLTKINPASPIGALILSLNQDAWGRPFNYCEVGDSTPGDRPTHNVTSYDLWSDGPNGQNEWGGGDDINNWSRE